MLGSSKRLKRFLKDAGGNTMGEYALLIALLALAVFILSPSVQRSVFKVFQNTSSAFTDGGHIQVH